MDNETLIERLKALRDDIARDAALNNDETYAALWRNELSDILYTLLKISNIEGEEE